MVPGTATGVVKVKSDDPWPVVDITGDGVRGWLVDGGKVIGDVVVVVEERCTKNAGSVVKGVTELDA